MTSGSRLFWNLPKTIFRNKGIRWRDRVPDVEVLSRAETPSVQALITASRLRWAGHVLRMPDSRLPKAVFYGELSEGKRKQGGQMLGFKDVLKRHMKNAYVKSETWEQDALDRSFWRATVKQSVESIEEKRQLKYQRAHERRHSTATSGYACGRCNRICRSRAGLAAHQRFCLT